MDLRTHFITSCQVFTVRTEVAERLCFYTCLSFCPHGGDVCPSAYWDTPLGRPPWAEPPEQTATLADLTHSYWNAFLLEQLLLVPKWVLNGCLRETLFENRGNSHWTATISKQILTDNHYKNIYGPVRFLSTPDRVLRYCTHFVYTIVFLFRILRGRESYCSFQKIETVT